MYLLGTVDFRSAAWLQERAAADIRDRSDTAATLILCEHPPIVTVGRDGNSIRDLPEPRELESLLLQVERVDRCGPTLVHAPGQLAVYPVLPLNRINRTPGELAETLRETAIAVCSELRVPAEPDSSDCGVWSRCGKVGFCGTGLLDGVSCHGYFLNVCPDMVLLKTVQSVYPENQIGSLVAQCARPIAMQTVRESFIRNLTTRLGYNEYNVFSSHPLLKPVRRPNYDLAANR